VALDEIKAYHIIIKKEASALANVQEVKEGEWYPIINPSYYIQRDQLREILKNHGFSNPDNVINALISKGFLIQLPEKWKDNESPKLRSLHMDVLVRSSQITTQYGRPPYLLSYKFAISKLLTPVERDRTIIPNKLGVDTSSKELWNKILSFFEGNQGLADTYVNIMKDYLGNSGLDAYQTYVLGHMFSSDEDTHAIIAPTGSGKTEVYLFYSLAMLMKWRILEKNTEKKILFVYPRKALTIDQAYRIVRLMNIANQHLRNLYRVSLTFAIRDGDTPKSQTEIEHDKPFRGVSCSKCGGRLVYAKFIYANKWIVTCKKCGARYDFIKVTRDEAMKADIIATNPWALETRLIDSAPTDVSANTLSNTALIVFDEVHEYVGLSGGILASLIDVMRSINSHRRLKLVFSSATVPSPRDFISKLSGDNNCQVYDFYEKVVKNKKVNISGERLVILGYFMMNPQYSWNTYCQLWTVLMAFLSYAYGLRNLQQPQSVLFINNLKELRRVRSGYIENLRVGEPKDHLQEHINPLEPYSYWHYLPAGQREQTLRLTLNGDLYKELYSRVAEIYSELPKEKREEVTNKLRGGDGLVVLSTSSLELGVDYDGVSFVLNAGLDNPISLIQRVGRGGRSNKTLRTVLGIFLARALPTEMLKTYDEDFMKALTTTSIEGYKLFVTKDNPQIIKRRMLIEAIARLAKKGKDTYASGASKGPINDLETLRSFVENILGEIQ
jgi:DEAD/DEAH box helicase domain-containing protein